MTELNTSPDSRASSYDVRFTSQDGLLGWLQAWLIGQALYGRGSVEIVPGALLIRGHRRTWLGTALPAELRASESDLQDVTLRDDRICCYLRGWYGLGRRCEFRLETPEHAAALFDELSRAGLHRRDDRYEAVRAFESRLLIATPRTVVTYAITVLNVLVFIALAIAGAGVAQVNVQWLIQVGANFGPLTTDAQWWRLLTAVFLHAGILHLLFNTWALWNAGRLVERMYGSWTLLLIYLAAGTLASLTSTLWDPLRSSVGASGAIFGVLGAFLAYLLKGRTRLPAALVSAYAPSTIVFVLFNLVNGIINPIIDNAAHVGGLISGFALGWLLARPSHAEQPERTPLWSACAAILLTLAALGASVWYARPDGRSVPQKFWSTHKWYLEGEARSFAVLNELEGQTRAGAISAAAFGDALERDVVPFWRDADARLAKEPDPTDQAEQDFALDISEFVRLRYEWAKELSEAIEERDAARVAEAAQLLAAAERARARISLVDLRAHADNAPGFSRSAPVRRVRSVFTRKYWTCVGEVGSRVNAAHARARNDGAIGRAAASCAIQRAFSRRDFGTLEALLKRFNDTRGDLLDGDSRLAGALGAFDEVFLTDADWEDAFLRLAEWRRQRPSSIWPDLLEVILLQEWAWLARGHDTGDNVAPLGWKAFEQRIEMAGTALWGCVANLSQCFTCGNTYLAMSAVKPMPRPGGTPGVASSRIACISARISWSWRPTRRSSSASFAASTPCLASAARRCRNALTT